ncbi:Protein CBG21277 [Caenorhabditis briggsae]|uniref:Protein CBG21277 n=1 Tax=Caenorhabditis briggsae TaxID=6238 RepID=A8XZR3_CAEBR|nr:Protein CBG21277 [Caenorhabditis briggsae]CAP38130.2 Protein CBG21277 [Caenorhabditis briggsae]
MSNSSIQVSQETSHSSKTADMTNETMPDDPIANQSISYILSTQLSTTITQRKSSSSITQEFSEEIVQTVDIRSATERKDSDKRHSPLPTRQHSSDSDDENGLAAKTIPEALQQLRPLQRHRKDMALNEFLQMKFKGQLLRLINWDCVDILKSYNPKTALFKKNARNNPILLVGGK